MSFPNSSPSPSKSLSSPPFLLPTKQKSRNNERNKNCPNSVFFFMAVLTISPQIFNYLSLLYLPIPLWVMAKSLRLVWVMLTGMVFFRKKYDRFLFFLFFSFFFLFLSFSFFFFLFLSFSFFFFLFLSFSFFFFLFLSFSFFFFLSFFLSFFLFCFFFLFVV